MASKLVMSVGAERARERWRVEQISQFVQTLNKANVLSSIAAYVANQSCFKNISLTIYFLKRNSGTQAAKIKKK